MAGILAALWLLANLFPHNLSAARSSYTPERRKARRQSAMFAKPLFWEAGAVLRSAVPLKLSHVFEKKKHYVKDREF